MHILVVGMGKSGTTGLCFRIANAMESPHVLFEPVAIRDYDLAHDNIVTKILTNSMEKTAILAKYLEQHFDKKVMIVRDPRDTVISWTLYRAGYHVIWEWDAPRITEYLNLLRRKELNPQSVSMLSLLDGILTPDKLCDDFKSAVRFSRERGSAYFNVRYEDFVRDRLEGLEEYLGMELRCGSDVPKHLRRVIRTKASGQWRSWFTEEDISFFKPLLTPYMEGLGYWQCDWELHERPTVQRVHASAYVKRIMNRRRKEKRLGLLRSV